MNLLMYNTFLLSSVILYHQEILNRKFWASSSSSLSLFFCQLISIINISRNASIIQLRYIHIQFEVSSFKLTLSLQNIFCLIIIIIVITIKRGHFASFISEANIFYNNMHLFENNESMSASNKEAINFPFWKEGMRLQLLGVPVCQLISN